MLDAAQPCVCQTPSLTSVRKCTLTPVSAHVVRHQYISVDPTTVCQRRLTELTQVTPIVLLTQKTRLAVIAPLDDVLGNPGQVQTSLTWHDGLRPSSEWPHPRSPNQALSSAQTTNLRRIIPLPPFAFHLASAIIWNIPVFHTYDRADLLHLNGLINCIDGTPMDITEARDPFGGGLFDDQQQNPAREIQGSRARP